VRAENLVASLLDYIHKSLWSKKKFVIDLLSHANKSTTSKHYAYVLNATKKAALKKISKGLSVI
jgi:integrase